MKADAILECFKSEFDRFWAMVEKQIDVCPDDLWTKKAGGYPYWQQVFHTVACVELFALPAGQPSKQVWYGKDVLLLENMTAEPMSKSKMKEFAQTMRVMGHDFIASMTMEKLTERHPALSELLGRDIPNQVAVMALASHAAYHIGCCDSVLRDHGIAGVY